ncbi:MAG: UDP-N-acetylglucosamine 2-epimerase (non-hydrolyzing) [Lewinellaceae bacterium]|nr:UDP-N-acetylglucosamine 2-epimerase (non-hydrolyzing) [Lewinellaceae bacterium]
MKTLSIVGARPNFMKVAPLHRAFRQRDTMESKIVHTGQHYDAKMSDIFFNQLELPQPDYYLGIGGGSHTQQTARIMLAFEEVVQQEKPDLVVVVGDVNSTIACALVAVKEGIPVAHVEAGLRSGDRSMPEELNRILTDSISDYLFVTEAAGLANLAQEGIPEEKVHFVGNVMIDSLIYYREKAAALKLENILGSSLPPFGGAGGGSFALLTMHRPSNVDHPQGLKDILQIIRGCTAHLPVVFAIHPRTENNLKKFGLYESLTGIPGLQLLPPQGYLEFLKLMDEAALIITDSGGIQEETTYLQAPCLTFRASTERPCTVELGTNFLMQDLNPQTVLAKVEEILSGQAKPGVIPPLWDGQAAERIAAILNHDSQD